MPDFEWLDEIPDSAWTRQQDGFSKFFLLSWFLEKSQVGVADWAMLFDLWGAEQVRRYQQFPCPLGPDGEAYAYIVFGPWDQGAAV